MNEITDRDEIIRQLYHFAIKELDPNPMRASGYLTDSRLGKLADAIVGSRLRAIES